MRATISELTLGGHGPACAPQEVLILQTAEVGGVRIPENVSQVLVSELEAPLSINALMERKGKRELGSVNQGMRKRKASEWQKEEQRATAAAG
jgi:hypothetical protein